MCEHVLVAYATRYGSTADIAEAIGMCLEQTFAFADVRSVDEVTSLSGYDAVIVGSPIRGGGWLPNAIRFLRQRRFTLSHLPVAYFTTCMTLREDTPENRNIVRAYLQLLEQGFPEIRPVSIGMFAGSLDYTNVTPLGLKLVQAEGFLESDFRDWSLICDWTIQIRPLLSVPAPV
jgi:menaquinone-dependent protoporphyrinogen oxidase